MFRSPAYLPSTLVAAALALASCKGESFHEGIGRPSFAPQPRAPASSLRVAEVLPGGFVELANADVALSLELAGLTLVSPNLSAPLPLSGTLAAGARWVVDAPALAPTPEDTSAAPAVPRGEVAVVDTDGRVHAYLAWGVDPAQLGSALFIDAFQRGAAQMGAFVRLPYPSLPGEAYVRGDDGTFGCATASPGDASTPGACATTPSPLRIAEVAPANEATPASWIELESLAAEPLPLGWLIVCVQGACSRLAAGTSLAAGARTLLCVTAAESSACAPDAADVIHLHAADAIAPETEVALLAPSGVDTPATAPVLSYVRIGFTGAAGDTFAQAAVSAGEWPQADLSVDSTFVAGESVSRNPGVAAEPAWYPGVSTPNQVNPETSAGSDLWTSCAAPAPWRAAAAPLLRVSALRRGDAPQLELENTGPAAATLAAYTLAVDGQPLELPTTDLPAGAHLALPAAILDTGLVVLRREGALAQYFAWGLPAPGAAEAVQVGVWPLVGCHAPRLDEDASFELRAGQSGLGADDYAVVR